RRIERPAKARERDAHHVRRAGDSRLDQLRGVLRPAACYDERGGDRERRYFSAWKSAMQFATKRMPTRTVSRVRLRSTMCVPPCEAGVKPMPPSPASRPECSKINAHSAIESRT